MSINTYQVDESGVLIGDGLPRTPEKKGNLQVVVAPPERPAGKLARWNTSLDFNRDAIAYGTQGTGTWVLEDDHREDKLYLTTDGSTYKKDTEIEQGTYPGYGDLPDWLTTTARPSQFCNWTDGAWVLDVAAELTSLKTDKVAELSAACQAYIYSGFDSSALGAAYHYPALSKDQQNLAASVLDSIVPGLPAEWVTPFWCRSGTGVWDFVMHTAAQIQEVGRDAKNMILAAQAQNKTLADQATVAANKTALAAIVWTDPA